MPTPVGFADCSVFIKHDLDDRPWALTFGIQTDLANFSPEDHAAHVFGATASAWSETLTDKADFVSAVLRFGQDGGDDLIAEFASSPIAGLSSSEKLPQNCALLVRKTTALGGRRNRGRCYIPGVLSESQVDGVGNLTTSQLSTFQVQAETWFTGLLDDGGGLTPVTPMVILHFDGSEPTPVVALTCERLIATQRRRMRR